MRTPIIAALVVVLAAAAGGGYYALEVYPQQRFRTGLDQALATLPPGTTGSYKTAHYSVASHRAVVTGFTVHGEINAARPHPFDVTIDSIETENPALNFPDLWADAVAKPAALTPDTALPVADAVIVKGLTIHSDMVNISQASIRITKTRLFPWALLHDGMPSWQEIQASLTPPSDPARIADLRPLLRAEAAALLGIAYDSYEAGAVKASETSPELNFTYDVRKMTGGAFDRGIMHAATAEGIAFTGDKVGAVSIDRMAMDGMDVREPMMRLLNGEPLTAALLDKMHIGKVAYDGIAAQPPGQPEIRMGGFSIGPVAFAQGMPVSGQLGWTDISVQRDAMPDPRAQDVFDKLGLQSITMSFTLAYDWDVGQRRMSVHDTMLKVNELGTLWLAADLADIIPDVNALAGARLAHAKLRLDDASLTERLLRAGAEATGADPATFRQQIANILHAQGDSDDDRSPELEAAGQAAGEFVASPRSLTIELAPKSPVPVMTLLGALAAPGKSAAMLGLTVSANQQ